METAYFNDIRQVILSELTTAKQSIKVAVAWFTNQELFNKLCEKTSNGLDVELIVIDDYINNGDYGLDFQKFIDLGGTLRYGNVDCPMHHKFCIIDDLILVNGSYNWTYYAESKNLENILLIKENASLIKQYVDEFHRLKESLTVAEVALKCELADSEAFDYFSLKEYLAIDLYYRGVQDSTLKHLESAARLFPKNKTIHEAYQALAQKRIIKKTTFGLGIEVQIDGSYGHFSTLINKGSTVPISKSGTYRNSVDNQTSLSIDTFKGNDVLTINNTKIGSITLNDLPQRPAGKAEVTVTFTLSEKGALIVKVRNIDTGNEMEAIYDVEKLVF